MITYRSRAPDVDGKGRCLYVQMLKPQEVVQLALSICKQMDFGDCDSMLLLKRMRKRIPTILEHAGCRLLIDRYYIALEDNSSVGFRYLYLTRWHAEETLRDHRCLLRCGQAPILDSKTLTLYGAALDQMRMRRSGYILYLSREGETAREYFDAPLLLIDDLGMEPLMENITVEQIYHLLNARLSRGLPTAVSTNLSRTELQRRYTERVSSRLLDARTGLAVSFLGRDIRLMRE